MTRTTPASRTEISPWQTAIGGSDGWGWCSFIIILLIIIEILSEEWRLINVWQQQQHMLSNIGNIFMMEHNLCRAPGELQIANIFHPLYKPLTTTFHTSWTFINKDVDEQEQSGGKCILLPVKLTFSFMKGICLQSKNNACLLKSSCLQIISRIGLPINFQDIDLVWLYNLAAVGIYRMLTQQTVQVSSYWRR